jgi:hypothetical protein
LARKRKKSKAVQAAEPDSTHAAAGQREAERVDAPAEDVNFFEALDSSSDLDWVEDLGTSLEGGIDDGSALDDRPIAEALAFVERPEGPAGPEDRPVHTDHASGASGAELADAAGRREVAPDEITSPASVSIDTAATLT